MTLKEAQPRRGTRAAGTVGKALAVLDAVAARPGGVRFADLQAGSAYPRATLYRLVRTLVAERMLDHDPATGTYRPGLRLLRLAHAAWAQTALAPVARPHLDALAAALGQTVHLAQLDHAQVLYVDKRRAARPVEMFSEAGKVGPAYCTGVGKALLAFAPAEALPGLIAQQSFHRFTPATLDGPAALAAELEAIRAAGHAEDREEHEVGIVCVAVPVRGPSGRCHGALSVTGRAPEPGLAALRAHLPALRGTAGRIGAEFETGRFPRPAEGETGGRIDGGDGDVGDRA